MFNRKHQQDYKEQPESDPNIGKCNILLLLICFIGSLRITAAQRIDVVSRIEPVRSTWKSLISNIQPLHTKIEDVCTNPNNKPGSCKSIYECPSFLNILRGSPTASQRTFISQSQCLNGSGRRPYVCYNGDIDFEVQAVTPPKPTTPPIRATGTKLLPEPPNCGHLCLCNRVLGGNDTAIDQYTWTALLEYDIKGKRSFNCGGSLINQRYVLTAGHCLIGDKIDLKMVRLGEYNTRTEIDCIVDMCNEKPLDIEVEEIIPHPDFDPFSSHLHNDIGLIRLARDVTYTAFINPVCLPLSASAAPVATDDYVTVTGWGRTLLSKSSNVKQHLSLRVVDQNSCRQKFASKKIAIAPSQVCAGGEFREDACDGDSGGPLMRKNDISWYIEGIVSYGYRCGLLDWPGVYTRVFEYIDWIQENIRP